MRPGRGPTPPQHNLKYESDRPAGAQTDGARKSRRSEAQFEARSRAPSHQQVPPAAQHAPHQAFPTAAAPQQGRRRPRQAGAASTPRPFGASARGGPQRGRARQPGDLEPGRRGIGAVVGSAGVVRGVGREVGRVGAAARRALGCAAVARGDVAVLGQARVVRVVAGADEPAGAGRRGPAGRGRGQRAAGGEKRAGRGLRPAAVHAKAGGRCVCRDYSYYYSTDSHFSLALSPSLSPSLQAGCGWPRPR